jgi:hypothetical protein
VIESSLVAAPVIRLALSCTTVNPVNGDQVIAQSKTAADLRTTVTTGEALGRIRYTCTVQTDDLRSHET